MRIVGPQFGAGVQSAFTTAAERSKEAKAQNSREAGNPHISLRERWRRGENKPGGPEPGNIDYYSKTRDEIDQARPERCRRLKVHDSGQAPSEGRQAPRANF